MPLSISERLENLQRRLGVRADGLLGPVTMTRLEEVTDQALGPAEEALEASLEVSTRSLDALVAFEISSAARYERELKHPIWPGASSGVTIGIGYDLGYNSQLQIERDWRGKVSDEDLERLLAVAGLTREEAKARIPGLRDLEVPFESARQVFFTSTLPRYAANTRRAFPGVEDLPADAEGALLSLIFNRGGSMTGSRRREMKAIQELVPAGDLDGIARQIRAMKRLWDPAVLPGLHRRRDEEADLVARADRAYEPEELVKL